MDLRLEGTKGAEEERETEAPRTILPSKSIRNENRKSFVGEHECAHTRTDKHGHIHRERNAHGHTQITPHKARSSFVNTDMPAHRRACTRTWDVSKEAQKKNNHRSHVNV